MTNVPTVPRKKRRKRSHASHRTTLRFTPYAWPKLLFVRDYGDTEIGGFGISSADNLLLIEDVQLVKQQCTTVTVAFDDTAVADFFDEQVDAGRRPEQFARVWIHTHPGKSAEPSNTDEETFARCFGNSDWSIMAIVAAGGATYARLQFNVGPAAAITIPMEIDFTSEFPGSDCEAWEQEYLECVRSMDAKWWDCRTSSLLDERLLDYDDTDWFTSMEAALTKEDYFD
ncbi:MAG: hypothetical protein H6822_09415 [Planctomycetaceae bacterium]|nr:hypothetical protein [Planctomycetaceae bacterium]